MDMPDTSPRLNGWSWSSLINSANQPKTNIVAQPPSVTPQNRWFELVNSANQPKTNIAQHPSATPQNGWVAMEHLLQRKRLSLGSTSDDTVDSTNQPVEPAELSTSAKICIAVGVTALVGTVIYLTTRKSEEDKQKA